MANVYVAEYIAFAVISGQLFYITNPAERAGIRGTAIQIDPHPIPHKPLARDSLCPAGNTPFSIVGAPLRTLHFLETSQNPTLPRHISMPRGPRLPAPQGVCRPLKLQKP